MKVSVVLPTYNEAGNIVPLIEQIAAHIPESWDREILVIDDNSPDGTHEMARKTFENNRTVRPVLRTHDRGFAKSIRNGIELATGDYIVVMDTDFTHDPAEIPRMLHVAQVYDIVNGSRFCAGGNMQDLRHYLASLVFNWFIRIVLRTQIQDNLGGYFAMKRDKLITLPFDAIFYGYGEYFFRLLHFAQKRGMTIVEIPARYGARSYGTSKSSFLKMLFTYTRAAFKVRSAARSDDPVRQLSPSENVHA